MKLVSYSDAKEAGLKFYFTGKKCKKNHVSERYTSTGGCCECVKENTAKQVYEGYFKELYNRDIEASRKKLKQRRKREREAGVVRKSDWAKRNPERSKAIKRSYKHRRRSIERAGISGSELHQWCAKQSKVCYWCGVDCNKDYHVDHYIPLSKGGKHVFENLVISCPVCNMRKSAKDPYDWAQEIGRLF